MTLTYFLSVLLIRVKANLNSRNGVNRLTIKQGSSAPGSTNPHMELRNTLGQLVDPAGNPVTRKSLGNHTPIDFDL